MKKNRRFTEGTIHTSKRSGTKFEIKEIDRASKIAKIEFIDSKITKTISMSTLYSLKISDKSYKYDIGKTIHTNTSGLVEIVGRVPHDNNKRRVRFCDTGVVKIVNLTKLDSGMLADHTHDKMRKGIRLMTKYYGELEIINNKKYNHRDVMFLDTGNEYQDVNVGCLVPPCSLIDRKLASTNAKHTLSYNGAVFVNKKNQHAEVIRVAQSDTNMRTIRFQETHFTKDIYASNLLRSSFTDNSYKIYRQNTIHDSNDGEITILNEGSLYDLYRTVRFEETGHVQKVSLKELNDFTVYDKSLSEVKTSNTPYKIVLKVIDAIIEMAFPYEEILYGFGMLQVKLEKVIGYWRNGHNTLDAKLMKRLERCYQRIITLTGSSINNIYTKSLKENKVNFSMISKMHMSSFSIRDIRIIYKNIKLVKLDKDTFDDKFKYNTDISDTIVDTTYDLLVAIYALDTKILRRAMFDIKASDYFQNIKEDICAYVTTMQKEIVSEQIEEWV